MARNIEPLPMAHKVWSQAALADALEGVRDYVEEQAAQASAWYFRNKRWKAFFSRYIRLGAIVATVGGGLYPVLATLMGEETPSALWSSLLVGLAAGLIGLDRAFGFSTGWIRYVTTATVIRRSLEEFRMDWTLRMAEAGERPTPEQTLQLIVLAKTFRLAIEASVLDETRAWAAEFQNNLAQLEREARAQADVAAAARDKEVETGRPGALEVTVPNAPDTDAHSFTASLEGPGLPRREETVAGDTRWVRVGLKAGHYRVVVSGLSGARRVQQTQLCEIGPGQTLRIQMPLPFGPAGNGAPAPEDAKK